MDANMAKVVKLSVVAGGAAVVIGGAAVAYDQYAKPMLPQTVTQTVAPATPAGDDQWAMATNLYQIFPAKFTPEGTIRAMIPRIEYLARLGVKAVWLMPVFKAMSTHGYDTIDYRTVEPRYGTNEDLRDFVAAAHSANIKVLLDLVVNHTGSEHPWFKGTDAERHDDWYIWASQDLGWNDPWAGDEPSYGKTWFQDPRPELDRNHNGNSSDDNFFYCVFCDHNGVDMPDLNWKAALQLLESGQRSPLFDELEGIMRYWLTFARIDGFRADAVRYMVENGKPSLNRDQPETHRVWQELRKRLSAISPGAILVAEAPTETYAEMRGYYGTAQNKEFQGAFHFKYHGALMDAVKSGWRRGYFFSDLFEIQSHLPYDDAAKRLLAQDYLFLSNHDRFTGDRVATQLGGDQAKTKLAASVYLLLSGNPVIYYGEEYGMQNLPGASGDDAIRGPMDWDEVSRQNGATGSVLQHYIGLLRIRNRYDALRGGRTIVVPSRAENESTFDGPLLESGRLALMREYYGEKIAVVTNLTGTPQNVRLDLGGSGLPAVAVGSPVTVLMGGGTSESVGESNLRNYPVGTIWPYCTRVLYLGVIPEKYQPILTYESPSSGWANAYFRGTANNWGTTAMLKTANGDWETTQTFGTDSPRFKISRNNDWSEAYPASDYLIANGAGDYVITFNDSTKGISVRKVVGPGWPIAYFRGTPNNWSATPMIKNGAGLWSTTQTFGSDNPRFKISRFTDWSEAYPASDYQISNGAGSYTITFDESSKAIRVTKAGAVPWASAYFRGTPNNWGTTAMERKAAGVWTTTQAFGTDNPRFKISHNMDWNEAYPNSDYPITTGPGSYVITFHESTKAIAVAKQ